MDLNLGVQSDTDKKLKKKLLIDYLYANLKQHNFWAYRYFFCELLALINVGGKLAGWQEYSSRRTQQTKDSPFARAVSFKDPEAMAYFQLPPL